VTTTRRSSSRRRRSSSSSRRGRDECYAMAEVEGVVEVKIEEAGVAAEVAAVGLSPHRGNTANNA
jgi:hypothetical protein